MCKNVLARVGAEVAHHLGRGHGVDFDGSGEPEDFIPVLGDRFGLIVTPVSGVNVENPGPLVGV